MGPTPQRKEREWRESPGGPGVETAGARLCGPGSSGRRCGDGQRTPFASPTLASVCVPGCAPGSETYFISETIVTPAPWAGVGGRLFSLFYVCLSLALLFTPTNYAS